MPNSGFNATFTSKIHVLPSLQVLNTIPYSERESSISEKEILLTKGDIQSDNSNIQHKNNISILLNSERKTILKL